jgi:Family of unknown function (DUF6263)
MNCNNQASLGRVRVMKPFLMIALMCLLAVAPALRADTLPADDQYFDIYSLILKGDRLVEKGRTDAARTNYLEAATELKKFQEDFPLWNPKVVKYRIGYLETKLAAPEPTAPANKSHAPAQAGNTTVAMTGKAADTGAPVELKLKWQVGKRYEEELDAVINAAEDNAGQQMKQDASLTQGFAISVLNDRNGNGRELEAELLGTKLDVKNAGMTMVSFDSAQPPADSAANPMTGFLKRISGAKLKVLLDTNGSPESLEGLPEFFKTIMGPNAGDPGDMMKQIPEMEANFKDAMAKSGGLLPDKPVKVGDTWSKSADIASGPGGLSGPASISQKMDFTFTGWETHNDHKCAVIQYTGEVTPKGAAGDPTSVQMHLTGTMWFDPELGTTVESTAKVGVDVNVNMGGQAMTTKMNGDVALKLTRVSDISM